MDCIFVRDNPFLVDVCMEFYFKSFNEEDEPTDLIFCKSSGIFRMNIKSRQSTAIHTFVEPLIDRPLYYCISNNQAIHVLAS